MGIIVSSQHQWAIQSRIRLNYDSISKAHFLNLKSILTPPMFNLLTIISFRVAFSQLCSFRHHAFKQAGRVMGVPPVSLAVLAYS